MARIETRRCGQCSKSYDVLESHGGFSALDRDDIDDLSCPGCGSLEHEVVVGPAVGRLAGFAGAKEYPYFDRGLGCVVHNARHHRDLMRFNPDGTDREVRLIPTMGEEDLAKEVDDQRHEQESAERGFREYLREMTEGPNRETYHRVRAHALEETRREIERQRSCRPDEVEVRWRRRR